MADDFKVRVVQLNADLYRIDTDSVWTIERVTKEWGKVEDLFTAEEIGWILSDALLALATSRATAARLGEVRVAAEEVCRVETECAASKAPRDFDPVFDKIAALRAALEVVDGK